MYVLGDSELSLLCKLWSGGGDVTQLSTGSRGYDKTSLSMYVSIQPENLLRHMAVLQTGDGFLDRFLLLSCHPRMVFTNVMMEMEQKLQEGHLKDFVNIFRTIYKLGKGNEKCYTLSESAQELYDQIFYSYVEFMNRKYGSYEESDCDDIGDEFCPSGKDTIHVIRLACVLHILQGVFKSHLDEVSDFDPGLEIQKESVVQAHCLFNILKQHKAIFIKSVEGGPSEMIKLKKVRSLQERVCGALMRLEGPGCLITDLNKRLKGVLTGELRQELIKLTSEGFGAYEEVCRRNGKTFIFYKPSPESLQGNDKYLKMAGFSLEVYMAKFNDVSKLSDFLKGKILKGHPHKEVLGNILSQDSDSEEEFHDA